MNAVQTSLWAATPAAVERKDGRHPGFHAADPVSSREAMARHLPAASTNKAVVLATLRKRPGSTAAELVRMFEAQGVDLGTADHGSLLVETRRRLHDLNNDKRVIRGPVRGCEAAPPLKNGARSHAITWWPEKGEDDAG